MSEPKEIKHIEQKKKSKKIKKTYNLLDFVVVKQKSKKTREINKVKVSKAIQKRGKVRKKKISTIKKKILKERSEKKLKLAEECFGTLREIPEDDKSSIKEITLDDDEWEIVEASVSESEDPELIVNNSDESCLKPNAPDSISPELCQDLSEMTISEVKTSPQTSPDSIQHSRNFREYCNHFITPEIKKLTENILKDLFKFQENKFQQNPVKAKANKRYVVGFKEVKKFLVVKRLKLIIIAPDLEKNTEIDNIVSEIKILADQNKIPYVFSVKRRHIGYLLLKKVPVSIVGIFDYQGTNENASELLKLVQEEKVKYKNKIVKAS